MTCSLLEAHCWGHLFELLGGIVEVLGWAGILTIVCDILGRISASVVLVEILVDLIRQLHSLLALVVFNRVFEDILDVGLYC